MIARRIVATVLPLAAAFAAACSSARSAPPASDAAAQTAAVATVDGQAITQKDVDARAQGALQRLRDEEYEARRGALDEIITEKLIDAQAAARGISREELMRSEVEAKVPRPTPAEIADVYERNKDRVGGRSLAQLTPEIERSIVSQKSSERLDAFLEELRKNGKVAVTLPQPRTDVPIPADARALGPEKAPVTIVEYSDYLCPYCQRAQSVLDQVIARNPGKVRFVHRDFLLGRPRSMAVARAAQCAADQGKFWDYRNGLMEAPGDWSDQYLLSRAAPLGLERASFQACLSSDKHDKAILQSSEDGTRLGVQSTPTFFINGRRVKGVRTVEQFQEIIDSEIKAGG
jgi:protein-disulfide isomerase